MLPPDVVVFVEGVGVKIGLRNDIRLWIRMFFSFLILGAVFFPSFDAHAEWLYDSGTREHSALIKIAIDVQDPEKLQIFVVGDQAVAFQNIPRSRWECETSVEWRYFSQDRIEKKVLEGLAWPNRWWGKLRPSYLARKKEKAVEIAREVYERRNRYTKCVLSFVPLVALDFESAQAALIDEVSVQHFLNIYRYSESGLRTVSYGFKRYKTFFASLSEEEDQDENGFLVRNVDGEVLIRCRHDRELIDYPCSVIPLSREN